MVEKILEMRGMRRKEIVDYFLSLDDEKYCEVRVGKEEFVTLGSITIPSTEVVFKGEEEYVDVVISRFRLKFLTAGG